MKNSIWTLFILILSVDLTGCASAKPMDQDSVGIKISQSEFDRKVEYGLSELSSTNEIVIDDYILLVRIYNTIEVNTMQDKKENYEKFIKLFVPVHIEKAEKKLEATVTKGMAYYSKKYDIYIGGRPHNNSMFRLMTD